MLELEEVPKTGERLGAKIRSYQDLFVYKKACGLATEVYRITGDYPRAEAYNLVSQMRRAANSIPANIAEGYRRTSRKDYIHFLSISHGSCSELDTFLTLSRKVGILGEVQYNRLSGTSRFVSILLTRLIHALNTGK